LEFLSIQKIQCQREKRKAFLALASLIVST
jgi:hypothetical protein